MKVSVHISEWQLRQPFRIANAEWTHSRCLEVSVSDGQCVGRGEAQGVFYLGETADSIAEQADAAIELIEAGTTRDDLLYAMPPGGARNAIDCALWDLECKRANTTIWALTNIGMKPVTTVFTIGLEESPEEMATKARAAKQAPVLKIKLDADRPYEKLAAIREARPDATLVVDANQGWSFAQLEELAPRLVELNLAMIEQPLPRGGDEDLEGYDSPILLAADESCLHTDELDAAASRYGMINIKLDKTGGLTEALRLASAAKARGCKLMVGNMMGTSLSMAPSFVLAQLCDFVDIDGPMLLRHDRHGGLVYEGSVVSTLDPILWG